MNMNMNMWFNIKILKFLILYYTIIIKMYSSPNINKIIYMSIKQIVKNVHLTIRNICNKTNRTMFPIQLIKNQILKFINYLNF